MNNLRNYFSTKKTTKRIFLTFLISTVVLGAIVFILNLIFPELITRHIAVILLIFFICTSLIFTLVYYLLDKKTDKISNTINTTINKIADGDFTAKIPNPKFDNKYINNIVDNFNKMVDELNSETMLKNNFISNFSHEFKTPIVSIKGYSELLSSADNLTDEQQEYLKIIQSESKRLANLANNTLLMSKINSQQIVLDKKVFSLDEQIKQCVLMLNSSFEKKHINVDIDIKNMNINSSEDLLKEVWVNLLTNSIKYTDNFGKIEIKSRKIGEYYMVSISDNGIGIDKEHLSHIFNKYFQVDSSNSANGNGLGLSITKRIIDLCNGKIEVKSELGTGTTFKILLPIINKK